jgi:aryl-alcohol dehydrogenase-like predicted oxidoreductase
MTEQGLVRTGLRVLGALPPVGPIAYGQWRYTTDRVADAQALLEAALDAGMNLIDTADVYGLDWGGTGFGSVETLLGRVLSVAPHLRDRMVLATKGGIRPPTPYDSSPAALRAACHDSLRRLHTDTIDLYQIHRHDLFTHPAEVAGALVALRDEGVIREVGVSNHTPAQVEALQAHLPFALVSDQPEYSALHLHPLRDGTFDACMQHGRTPLAWSPLAGGRLATGDGVGSELLAELNRLADREEVERSHIALAFVLAHPSAPVAIIGTQRPDRIGASLAALRVHLDRNDVYRIVQASEGVPLP